MRTLLAIILALCGEWEIAFFLLLWKVVDR